MANLPPQPPINLKIADPNTGVPANYWQDYLIALDRIVRALAGNSVGPLVNAVNDADAARQGIAVGALYQTSGTVKIRLA